MKYDAPATAASVARGITRSDVRKILTGLPRENILLRASKRCGERHVARVEFIVHIITHRRASRRTFYSRKIVSRFNSETRSRRYEPNNSSRLFNCFLTWRRRKIMLRIMRDYTAVITKLSYHRRRKMRLHKRIVCIKSTSSVNNSATIENNCHSHGRFSYPRLSIGYSCESIQRTLEILASAQRFTAGRNSHEHSR